MKDLKNDIGVLDALNIQEIISDTTTAGAIIDRKGFESLTFSLQSGTVTDGAYAVLIEDGGDSGLSDAAAVADKDLIGTEANAAFALTDDNEVRTIAYIGVKRYVRVSLVSTATTSGGFFGATAIKGHANLRKVEDNLDAA